MKKEIRYGIGSGWAIMETLTGRFFREVEGHSNYWIVTSNPTEAYLGKTRKEAVEIAKHLGKGRKMTVAKMTITFDISYQGATEVTGEDASIF